MDSSAQLVHDSMRRGFTLVELLIVMGVMGIIMQLGSVSLLRFQQFASIQAATGSMLSDIKQQQLKAMVGDTGNIGIRGPFGVHFLPDRYVLFSGPAYDPGDSTNFVITTEQNIRIDSTTLTGNSLVFSAGSGEVVTTDQVETITLRNTANGESRTITINRLGVITDID
ncbi:MAG: type II secretion system GspH family protein [Patescibacteria group bacterium]|nr:type II secretion system GspH family protein [Patescibacteria group bacterium]